MPEQEWPEYAMLRMEVRCMGTIVHELGKHRASVNSGSGQANFASSPPKQASCMQVMLQGFHTTHSA